MCCSWLGHDSEDYVNILFLFLLEEYLLCITSVVAKDMCMSLVIVSLHCLRP